MRKVGEWLGAACLVALLTGCPPPYPKCSSDEACKDHSEVCVQGQCQECATDSNCKQGFVCDANRCVPKPECTATTGCGPNQKCSSGKCITPECDKDTDCGAGGKCQNRRCAVARAPGSCSTNDDCQSGENCKAGTCVSSGSASADACTFEPIGFDFNEYKLSSEAQAKLATLADCIKKQKAKLTVEGHADERGTEEYNLQLSNKRAASVKRYLTDLGVTAGSLETVGYGENRPAQQGSSEAAWAANRRVEFVKR